MKKNKAILERVREIEYKRGISYATADGKLYKGADVLYILALIFTLAVHSIILLGFLILNNSGNNPLAITIIASSLFLIAGLLLSRFKLNIPAFIANLLTSIFLIAVFANTFEVVRFIEYKPKFYWSHLLPLGIIIICNVIMFTVCLRAKIKTDRLYNRLVNDIYETYKKSAEEITEESWQEFLMNYKPELKRNKKTKNEG